MPGFSLFLDIVYKRTECYTKEAWVAKLLGTHLSIQVHEKGKFSRWDNSSLAVEGLNKDIKKSHNFHIFGLWLPEFSSLAVKGLNTQYYFLYFFQQVDAYINVKYILGLWTVSLIKIFTLNTLLIRWNRYWTWY